MKFTHTCVYITVPLPMWSGQQVGVTKDRSGMSTENFVDLTPDPF